MKNFCPSVLVFSVLLPLLVYAGYGNYQNYIVGEWAARMGGSGSRALSIGRRLPLKSGGIVRLSGEHHLSLGQSLCFRCLFVSVLTRPVFSGPGRLSIIEYCFPIGLI